MTEEQWRNKQSKRGVSYYAHFDYRVSLDQCWNEISSAERIQRHGFYPFIHYTSKNRKVKDGKKQESKKREIYYAAHKDSWIYRYYAFLLNEKYNKRLMEDGTDCIAIAYRNNHPGKNNIDYACSAFRFISNQSSCYIMIGDFTSFFDNLDHSYLKERLCDLLDVEKLPPDYYAVFKNITGFSYVEIEDILDYLSLEHGHHGRRSLNERVRVMQPKELHSLKSMIKKNPNRGAKGVPQGSPISAVLANIYMLKADKQIADYMATINGFYMRYSDDFIAVVPDTSVEDFKKHYETIKGFISDAGNIELKEEKTKAFHYKGHCVNSCVSEIFPDQKIGKNVIEFLGFAYDGVHVRLRDRTISRYYNKVYRKARTIARSGGVTKKGNRIGGAEIYRRYSIKGSKYYHQTKGKTYKKNKISERNFLDYVHDAKERIGMSFIDTVTPRHMQKIKKMTNKKE